jgi:hypothetical protein
MNVINIKGVSNLLKKSSVGRKLFKSAIKLVLFLLEHQRLIDKRDIEKMALDFERGTINLGDDLSEKIMARAFGEYVINDRLRRGERTKFDLTKRKDTEKEITPKLSV